MADEKKQAEIAGGVPIIGQETIKYWIGDKDAEFNAAMLELSMTPEQAVQGFGHYVHTLKVKGKGLPAHVYFPWIYTSIATEKLRADNDALQKRVRELEETAEDLLDRLAALEEA